VAGLPEMVCIQTKNTNLGKFGRLLRWKMLVKCMAIWSILWPSGRFYDIFVHVKVIWYILPVLVSCSKTNLATLVGGRAVQGCQIFLCTYNILKRVKYNKSMYKNVPNVQKYTIWS
jgi:hypothetical protein